MRVMLAVVSLAGAACSEPIDRPVLAVLAPAEPVAVGATADFQFTECTEDGADCSVGGIYLVHPRGIADPSVFAFATDEPMDDACRGTATCVRLVALAPGETTLHVDISRKFSTEPSSRDVSVRAATADRAEVTVECASGARSPLLLLAGGQAQGDVTLWSGDSPLAGGGYFPFEGGGLTLRGFGSRIALEIPAVRSSGELRSKIPGSTWSLPWQTFDVSDVSEIVIEVSSSATTAVVDVEPRVAGEVPCMSREVAIEVTTSTPSICSISGGRFITKVASGTCTIVARVVGTTVTATDSVTFR